MLDVKLLYVATVFVQGNDIIPNVKNITFLVKEFEDKGLIPNNFRNEKSNNSRNNLQLSNSNNELIVRFLENRIDIVRAKQPETNDSIGEFDSFCDEAIEIWQRINKEYHKKGSRLGVTSHSLWNNLSEEKLQNIYSKIFTPLPIKELEAPINWENHIVSRVTKQILNKDETINLGLGIDRLQGNYKEKDSLIDFDGIKIAIDINTISENDNFRFEDTEITAFLSSAKIWNNDLTQKIKTHLL
jgi:hypothetical protein